MKPSPSSLFGSCQRLPGNLRMKSSTAQFSFYMIIWYCSPYTQKQCSQAHWPHHAGNALCHTVGHSVGVAGRSRCISRHPYQCYCGHMSTALQSTQAWPQGVQKWLQYGWCIQAVNCQCWQQHLPCQVVQPIHRLPRHLIVSAPRPFVGALWLHHQFQSHQEQESSSTWRRQLTAISQSTYFLGNGWCHLVCWWWINAINRQTDPLACIFCSPMHMPVSGGPLEVAQAGSSR